MVLRALDFEKSRLLTHKSVFAVTQDVKINLNSQIGRQIVCEYYIYSSETQNQNGQECKFQHNKTELAFVMFCRQEQSTRGLSIQYHNN